MLTAEPKAYGSNWYAAHRVESPARARLTAELDVDVCVIGAGLAGLTVAREVARLGWSVAVLEAQSVAWSASGRNTGVVLPGFGVSPDALIERVGLDQAKALWKRSEAGVEYVRNAAREMPGAALVEGGWLHVSKTDDTRTMAHEAALLAGEFGVAVEPWPADRVREALHSPRYFHALHYPRGFCLHPLNYALGLAAAAEAAGARIFEDTPVVEIDPAGVRKRVITRHSRVRAGHVVLAGNVHMAELVPQFANTLTPIFNTVVITAPLGDELQKAVSYPGAVSDTVLTAHHHRVVDGRRLMWSGRSSVLLGKPQRQADALIRQIRRTYPALRAVKAEHAWIGVAGQTVHGMPQIGEITPGLWLLGGFGGHGLSTTAMGGEMLARAIVEGDQSWQMFSPFALVWAGGRFGRIAQQVAGWSQRCRETIGAMLARRRDGNRRQVEAARVAEPAPAVSPPVVPDTVPDTPRPPEPAVEPVARFITPATESEPAAVTERAAPSIPEGQSGGAAPPLPDEQAAPAAPRGRKRGPRKKQAGAPQTTLKDLSQQIIENDTAPADPAPREPDGPGAPQPPPLDKKI
jgi:gamma-glutamylputrescine oxidase